MDALAAAEIARIVTYPQQLDAFVERALAAPGRDAFRDEPVVQAILTEREADRDRGPIGVFDAVCAATHVRQLCAEWGNTSQRTANLDALRSHATAYVEETAARSDAVTLVGLVRALYEIADDQAWDEARSDSQALLSDLDAITISTWHRAKGLEWPITVLFGLETLREPQAHGVHVMSDRAEFEIADPLGGRWIRMWPNPYTNSQQKGAVRDAFERSNAYGALVARAEREALRVLYVGWTRARDRLVLAAKRGALLGGIMKTLSAIDRTLITEPPVAATSTIENVRWAGVVTTVRTIPSKPAEVVAPARTPGKFAHAAGDRGAPHAPARSSPSTHAAIPCVLGEIIELGPPISLLGSPDMEDLGHAIHGFLAADRASHASPERLEMASGLLARFGVERHIASNDVLAISDRLRECLEARFASARLHRELPIKHRHDGVTTVAGTADLVLVLPDHVHVIDHKSFPGTAAQALERAKTYSGQLAAYAAGLTGPVSLWIHFPIVGRIVEILLSPGTTTS